MRVSFRTRKSQREMDETGLTFVNGLYGRVAGSDASGGSVDVEFDYPGLLQTAGVPLSFMAEDLVADAECRHEPGLAWTEVRPDGTYALHKGAPTRR